jgi:hypothetical protein
LFILNGMASLLVRAMEICGVCVEMGGANARGFSVKDRFTRITSCADSKDVAETRVEKQMESLGWRRVLPEGSPIRDEERPV